MFSPASLVALDPYHRANSVPELMAWSDVDFVRCAYVTLLGRQPDAEGEAHHAGLLRRGTSKWELLWQIRRSPEGRDHDPGIAGLDKALRRHRNANRPVVGAIIRAFTHQEGNSPAERGLRTLENRLSAALLDQERARETESLALQRGLRTLENRLSAALLEQERARETESLALQRRVELWFANANQDAAESAAAADALMEAMRELKVDLRSQHQTLQHGVELWFAKANQQAAESAAAADAVTEAMRELKVDVRSQYQTLQLGVDLCREETKDVFENHVGSLIAAQHEHQGTLRSRMDDALSLLRGAVKPEDMAIVRDRLDAAVIVQRDHVTLARALSSNMADLLALARTGEIQSNAVVAELQGVAKASSVQSHLDAFEKHVGGLIAAQLEHQGALRSRMDDTLSLLRGAVKREDMAIIRDRLDAAVIVQRDHVTLARALSSNMADLLALARAGLSDQLPGVREVVEALRLEQAAFVERMVRIDRYASQQTLVSNNQILLTTDVGFVVLPDDDPVLLVVVRHMNGVLEPGTVAVIRHLLHEGDTMIDVGAHVGLITLVAAKKVGELGRIIAIEPVSRSANALETMLHVNFINNSVRLHRCAAGRAHVTSQINVGRILGHSSLLPLDESSENAVVDVRTIDELVPAGTVVKLVKLDVEGSELDCLNGMDRLLGENPTIGIVAEFGPSHLKRAGQSINKWFGAFEARGFEAWEIDEASGHLSPPRSPRKLAALVSINFLFWRGDKRPLADLLQVSSD